jgi:hypothetical protein
MTAFIEERKAVFRVRHLISWDEYGGIRFALNSTIALKAILRTHVSSLRQENESLYGSKPCASRIIVTGTMCHAGFFTTPDSLTPPFHIVSKYDCVTNFRNPVLMRRLSD